MGPHRGRSALGLWGRALAIRLDASRDPEGRAELLGSERVKHPHMIGSFLRLGCRLANAGSEEGRVGEEADDDGMDS